MAQRSQWGKVSEAASGGTECRGVVVRALVRREYGGSYAGVHGGLVYGRRGQCASVKGDGGSQERTRWGGREESHSPGSVSAVGREGWRRRHGCPVPCLSSPQSTPLHVSSRPLSAAHFNPSCVGSHSLSSPHPFLFPSSSPPCHPSHPSSAPPHLEAWERTSWSPERGSALSFWHNFGISKAAL